MFFTEVFLVLSVMLQLQPGKSSDESLTLPGQQREYILHVPKNYKSGVPHPVVFAFHGLGETARTMEEDSGLSEKADKSNFIVVYPNGTGTKGSWNAGSCCEGNTSDDIEFVKVLIKDVSTKLNVEPKRIYATGMSNGGMLVNRVACEMADTIAAVASVAGTLVFNGGAPSRSIPVMHIHGKSDRIVPYSTVTAHKQFWINHNHANVAPITKRLTPAPHEVTQEVFASAGTNSADIVIITIENGGHLWPGRPVPARIELPVRLILGETTQAVSANDEIWAFFNSHPLP